MMMKAGEQMTIKPVDAQISITKSNEYAKQKSEEQAKNVANQHQQALTSEKQIERNMSKVIKKENIEKSRVTKDKENKQNKDNKKDKKNKPENDHIIDITV
jgi:hypothetical protein